MCYWDTDNVFFYRITLGFVVWMEWPPEAKPSSLKNEYLAVVMKR